MDNTANNKRIAKNTLLLYVRMGVMMVVSLFTSRIILDALGIEDYGIYNAVGGLVTLFSVLTGALSVATSRYITYALGQNDKQRLSSVFSTAINIHIFLAISITVIAEIVGVWFLNSRMNIPADRMYAANWVLQFSILTFVIGLLNVPYSAAIISHEKMGIYAYFSIYDVFVKLAIVYLLYLSPIDRLILFALLLCLASITTQLIYYIYCRKKFEECRYRMVFDKALLKNMSGFVGWAFFGNAAVILKDQGMTILLNIFCGPVVNAAQGIANKVNATAYRFVDNFLVAVNPQLTKSYASGNITYMNELLLRSSRLSAFLLLALITPITMNIDLILNLWLIEVPDHTNTFVILILFYSFCMCFTQPLVTAILANGKIKIYEIWITVIYLLNIIAAYGVLKIGMQPEVVYFLLIIFKIWVVVVQIYLGRKMFSLDRKMYVRELSNRVLPILICSLLFICTPELPIVNIYVAAGLKTALALMVLLASIFLVGLRSGERTFIIEYVKKRIHK